MHILKNDTYIFTHDQDQAGLLLTEEITLTFDKVKETGLRDPLAEEMVRGNNTYI
jgi:hypothetical protein